MVYKHLPDIIIGYQSQIDNWYNSAEVAISCRLLCIYVHRKDCCKGADGVFTQTVCICIKDTLSASAISSLDTDADIIAMD